MHNDLGVHGGLEDRAPRLKLILDQLGIDDVAIVGDGDGAAGIVDHDRLYVLDGRFSGGRIADVSNSSTARQILEHFLIAENIGNMPHAFVGV